MTKEIKTIFLVALSLTVYAFYSLIQQGSFVYPYPLAPFIFLLIAFQFSYWHRSKILPVILVCLIGILGVLSSEVFWEIILSTEQLELFLDHSTIHILHLLYGIGLIIWGISTLWKQREILPFILTAVGILFFTYGFFIDFDILILLSYSLIAISTILKPVNPPFHLLWILLLLLEGTKWITQVFT